MTWAPVSCSKGEEGKINCDHDKVNAMSDILTELGYVILYIFTLGPIRLFLKIKEGKLTVDEIIEGYEDQRGILQRGDRQMENRGLLPTTTRPMRRANPQ